MKLARVLLTVAAVITLGGCGYTSRSAIREKFQTIYVAPFVNKTDVTQEAYAGNRYRIYRPTLETEVTKATIDKFLADGNLRTVKEESADLVLRGELIDYRRDPLRYDKNDEVMEFRINIVVNLSLLNKQDGALLWEEKGFTGDTTYFAKGANTKSESIAIADAVKDLARRIVERTVEMW